MQYIILDWAFNRMYPQNTFDSFDDAWEFVYEQIDDEEAYQDLFVIPEEIEETEL